MIEIRTGNYTEYCSHQCQLFEVRSEAPWDEKQFSIYCSLDEKLEGFRKHPQKDILCKGISIQEIDNAYSVTTYGIYKSHVVQVFGKQLPDPCVVEIAVDDAEIARKCGLLEMDSNWFIKDIHLNDLSEIWEERFPALGLSMPAGLKHKEYIWSSPDKI